MNASIPPAAAPQAVPRPRGLPVLGLIPQITPDPLGFFQRMGRTYPRLVRLDLGPRTLYLTSHPEQVKYVLQDNHRNFNKGYDMAKPVLGEGLVSSEGEFWRRQRRLMQPAFHRQRLAELIPIMTGASSEAFDLWAQRARSGEPLDLARELMLLTQTIIVRTMFSVDLGSQGDRIADAFATSLEYLNSLFLSPFPFSSKLPTPLNRRFARERAFLDNVIAQIIQNRREQAVQRNDLVGMLMAARDEETGEGMSDRQMRDEIMTIFLAGHETTATLLAWTLYLLGENPGPQEEIRAEFSRELGGEIPSAESLGRMEYARRVFHEVLRLYPPAWMFARMPIEDDCLAGYTLPAGVSLMLSPWVTHRLPEFWPEPEKFDPERFTEAGETGRPRYAWFPFGGGPRMCIGNNFALMEAPLILAMFMQRFRYTLLNPREVRPTPVATLRPRPSLIARLQELA